MQIHGVHPSMTLKTEIVYFVIHFLGPQLLAPGLIILQIDFGTQKTLTFADSKQKSAFHLPWYGLGRTVPGESRNFFKASLCAPW